MNIFTTKQLVRINEELEPAFFFFELLDSHTMLLDWSHTAAC
jgi:hypothetical protein